MNYDEETFYYDLHQYIGDDEKGVAHFEVFEFTVPLKFMLGKDLNNVEMATKFVTLIKKALVDRTLTSKGVRALGNNIGD